MKSCGRECGSWQKRWVRNTVLVLLFLLGRDSAAEVLDALDPTRDWLVHRIRIEGNEAIPARKIREAMITRGRPWYKFWRSRPMFDPVAFKTDLERIEDLYRRNGHYHGLIEYGLELPSEGDAVVAVVEIEEGPPVRVVSVDVDFGENGLAPQARERLLAELPLRVGTLFTEERYNGTAARLRAYHREVGYARAEVTKRASVDVRSNTASVTYGVDSGPECVFDDARVEGVEKVAESVVTKEVAFTRGQRFEASRLDRTRDNLLALRLFRTVNVREQPGAGSQVDVRVRVRERPPREIRFGLGFDTEAKLRGSFDWRHEVPLIGV